MNYAVTRGSARALPLGHKLLHKLGTKCCNPPKNLLG